MKKNVFPLSLSLLLCIAALCGCTEGDEPIAATDGSTLTIHATADGFTAADGADTRASENGYITTFTAGDEIGVFAVKNGAVIADCKNVKCIRNADGSWSADALAPVYYYIDAQYFAYYPYKSELPAENITDVSGIVDYFNKNIATDQGTYDNYTAWDLMTAALVLPDGNKTLSFSFTHQMSLIEISLPVQKYKTSDAADAYEYAEPAINATFSITKEDAPTPIIPYNTGKGVYRYIVPAETSCTVAGEFQKVAGTTIGYKSSTLSLSTGKYKLLNVTYDGAPTTITERALAAGDFYYSDGGIVPGDAQSPPSTGCIGIIFWVGDATKEDRTLKADHKGCTHGLVIALTEYVKFWQGRNSPSVQNWLDNNKRDVYLSVYTMDNIQGYNNTKATEEFNKGVNSGDIVYGVDEVINYRKTVSAPSTSSDWYLPSAKELTLWDRDAINNKLSKISGATTISASDYWSLTEDNNSAWVMTYLLNRNELAISGKQSNLRWRPVLAF